MEHSTPVESVQQSFHRSNPPLRNLPLPTDYPITSKPLFSNLPMKMPILSVQLHFPEQVSNLYHLIHKVNQQTHPVLCYFLAV